MQSSRPSTSHSHSAGGGGGASEGHDAIFPTPSTSPWSSPKAFPASPWDRHPSHATVVKRCGKILSLGLSGSGVIYAGTESSSIRVWKAPGFSELTHLVSGSPVVGALLVSPDDKLVFTAHCDRRIRVWRTDPVHVRKGKLPSFRDSLIGTILPRSSAARRSSSTGSPSNRLKHSSAITSLAYSAAAALLYSASTDRSIKVWDIGDMKCVETIYAHDDAVTAVAVATDGLLYSGSDDTTVKVWERTGGGLHALLFYLQQQRSPVKAVAVSEEDEEYVLYAGCADGCLYYWRKGRAPGQMRYLGFMRGHSAAVTCLAATGEVVASGSGDASVRVWKRSGGKTVRHQCTAVLSGHMGPVRGVAVMAGRERSWWVYSGSLDGSVKQWWVSREMCGEAGAGDDESGGEGDGEGESDYFEISGPLKGLLIRS